MKRKNKAKAENSERWLVSYADFMTLLMVFFVVLYSTANIDLAKYEKLAKSMGSAMGGEDSSAILVSKGGSDEGELKPLVQTEQEKLIEVQSEIKDVLEALELNDNVSATIEERGLVISFNDTVFFDSSKADIKESMESNLVSISQVLNKVNNYIRVEGHTDNLPINTSEFKSNWHLSSVRASNVVEFLIDYGQVNPERLSAVGYGEYRTISDNNTEEGRSENRRVDILILNNELNYSED